jgi:hypothetical protein
MVPLLHRIKLSPEELTGIQTDQELVTWTWSTQNRYWFQGPTRDPYRGDTQMEADLLELILRSEHIHQEMGNCPNNLHNAWFTDGLASVAQGKMKWTASAVRPWDNMALIEQDTSMSAQHAELTAVVLAVTIHNWKAEKMIHLRLMDSHKWHRPMVTYLTLWL